jgi:hypothetical protein
MRGGRASAGHMSPPRAGLYAVRHGSSACALCTPQAELLAQADVVVLHNVFEWFHEPAEQRRLWTALRSLITRPGPSGSYRAGRVGVLCAGCSYAGDSSVACRQHRTRPSTEVRRRALGTLSDVSSVLLFRRFRSDPGSTALLMKTTDVVATGVVCRWLLPLCLILGSCCCCGCRHKDCKRPVARGVAPAAVTRLGRLTRKVGQGHTPRPCSR